MQGKFGLLSQGKASSHSTALPGCFFLMCAVFSCFHTNGREAYSFTTDGYGICNVKHVCTRVDSEGQKKTAPHPLPPQGIDTRVLGFEFEPSGH